MSKKTDKKNGKKPGNRSDAERRLRQAARL
ncbi:MAG: hypothetical protein RIS70_1067, partial [Planctomycetota bacterium]